MSTKFASIFIIICFVVVSLSIARVGQAAPLAVLYIDPPETTELEIGESFTLNVKIANITNLAGWQVVMYYDNRVIAATAVEEGPFLKSVQNTIFVSAPAPMGITNDYNSTHGRVMLACATIPVVGANGSGTLARVTFIAVGAGSTDVIFSDTLIPPDALMTTKLLDPAREEIPFDRMSGLVSLIANDIGVTKITVSKTIVSNTQITINVTVANLGNYTATFDAILYYDSTEIGNRTITDLLPSTNLVLTFFWNTSTVPKGNYTIRAYAPPIIGEDITANNELVGGWIVKSILGDINGDGKVNILDISLVAKAFQTKPGDARWEPNADLDDNELINIIDISRVAKEFGKVDP